MINVNKILFKYQFAVWAIGLSIGLCGLSHAATTDLSTTPLASSASTAVRPNILFTLDESGSMAWNFLPDYAGGVIYTGGTANHCKVSNTCGTGETPFQTNEYNGMAYNPRLTYNLPVNADGTTKNSQNSANTTGWTVVPIDGYGVQSASQINLTTGYPEVTYCNTGVCKKNGVHTNNPFLLRATVLTDNPPVYAFPGTLPGATLPASTLVDGVMNQGTSVSGSVFNGTLDLTVAGFTSLNLTGEAVSYSGSLVTVTYTAPTAPPLTTGDTVVVSGGSCSTGYKDTGTSHAITVVDATHFTYVSTGVAVWTNTSCTVKATKASHTAVAPKISKSGSTVTVTLSSAPTPALSSASLVTVTGAGCDAGYTVSSVPITLISSTSFSYTATNATIPTGNTTCNITQVIFTPPASPGISLSGTTVTVYRSAHGLVTGDVIQVSNGTSGICDSGYKTSGTVSITKIDNNTFSYNLPIGSVTTNSNCRIDKMTVTSTVVYTTAGTQNSNPYYFVIVPTEYCDSIYLTRCVASTVPVTLSGISYSFPAPVRYCKDDATALLPPGDAGAQILANGTINCQAKFSVGTGINLRSVRYGLFWRGDIVPTRTTYSNEYFSGTINGTGWVNPLVYSNTLVIDRSKRSDCAAAPNCTYAEEMTNFANFYAYYRTRMQMMKSAAGQAFSKLDNRYRIGFSTINQSASKYLAMAPFDVTQKTNWYAKFYAINPGNSTPLREALSTAGRYFAGKKPGAVMTDDPMEYACQQNYELITTDGYWNGTDSAVKEIDGTTTMRNYDNVDSGASKRSDGAYDGGVAGATDTLADVALYYYQLDLRNAAYGNCTGALGTDVCQDIVPMTPKDTAAGLAGTQHMTTFSLGLADGLMTYQSDYETATSGDFSKIKTGATGCTFSGAGTCNWPLPVHDSQSALDDLWHAAVNGRGTYYNARDPASLTSGLTSALSGISIKVAAAAASATSSPNITQTDRSIFSSTYRTTVWDGEVTAQLIDTSSGNVLPTIVWSAQAQLDTLVHADPTPSKVARHIYMFDSANSSGNHIKDFQYAALTATEAAYFDNKCTSILLTQCTSPAVTAQGNIGSNLVNYLRGDQSLEGTVFRVREHLLGDTVNAKPAYVKLPKYGFLDSVVPTYNTFKTAQTSRQGALYMGSNDGMLHAFNTDTGAEMWSYVPRIVMPNLYKLADTSYATLHQYYVDGSPETMDIFVDSATATANGLTAGWHSILVGGLGLGGRGFYALDVTDPANPVALWEVCSSSSLCAISDPDIGYSYGNPIITKRSTDGSWVVLVTSGYNNASPGSGAGTMYVLDAVSGVVLSKTSTGTATNPPSGLAKLSPWIDNLNSDYTTRFIYGGDLNGDLWRFDLGVLGSAAAPTVTKIATLMDGTGATQSVTTRPELGDPLNNTSNSLGGTGNPAVFVGTGRYLGTTDLSNVQIQSIYGIKDNLSTTCAAAGCYPNARNSLVHQYIYQPTATTRTTSTNAVSWSINSGWFADFQVSDSGTNLPVLPSPSPGERVNLDPLLVSGTLIVVTNVPETSACTIGGTSWLYSFDFLTGQFVSTSANQIAGVKLGNAVSVGIVVGRLPAGQLKGWVTTADGSKLNVDPVTKGTGPTERTSWRELTQ